jgi:glycosyltransferase involved in cell wall biosynthesis
VGRPSRLKGYMRILLGLMDAANQMRVQALHLAMLGHYVRFYDSFPFYMKYQGAEELRLRELPKLSDYDVFEIFFASFGPKDGRKGMEFDTKFLHHFCGSEVRQLSIAKDQNPYAKVKNTNEEKIVEALKRGAQLTDHCTLRDMELHDHVAPYFKHVHIVPRSVDLDVLRFNPETKNRRPLVVHAPTDVNIKGTQTIIDAVEKAKGSGIDFDFRLIAGMPHEVVTQIVSQADLLIDQLHVGTYGVAAIEAMAMGTPVMCYISDYMKQYLPDLPVYDVTPDSIGEILPAILSGGPTIDRKACRRYVEEHHDAKVNIHKLVEVYQCL